MFKRFFLNYILCFFLAAKTVYAGTGITSSGNIKKDNSLNLPLVFLLLIFSIFYLSVTVEATDVYGVIRNETTWSHADIHYVVTGIVLVNSGSTLTIEAGVTIKFNSGNKLQINGRLIAQGTSRSRITFTSAQSSPSPGDWGYIYFTDTSADATYDGSGNYTGGSILEFCDIEFGGSSNGNVYILMSAPFINYCHIKHSSLHGIYVSEGAPKISNSNIIRNGKSGVYISPGGSDVSIKDSTIDDNNQGEGVWEYRGFNDFHEMG